MSRIDETRPFIAVRIAVLTVSDTRSLAEDKSGDLLASRLIEAGTHLPLVKFAQTMLTQLPQR
ncbi:MAG: hypothetical protein CM15mP80_08790 [Alphaproteobacteria bacterium]|nr:MAG: hypothetical protein CM15mP80_08790 [Alphaproteobacteria bacterium]